MRSFLVAIAGLLIATGAEAKVAITVDKDNQQKIGRASCRERVCT